MESLLGVERSDPPCGPKWRGLPPHPIRQEPHCLLAGTALSSCRRAASRRETSVVFCTLGSIADGFQLGGKCLLLACWEPSPVCNWACPMPCGARTLFFPLQSSNFYPMLLFAALPAGASNTALGLAGGSSAGDLRGSRHGRTPEHRRQPGRKFSRVGGRRRHLGCAWGSKVAAWCHLGSKSK